MAQKFKALTGLGLMLAVHLLKEVKISKGSQTFDLMLAVHLLSDASSA